MPVKRGGRRGTVETKRLDGRTEIWDVVSAATEYHVP